MRFLIFLLLFLAPTLAKASIGDVILQEGNSTIERDSGESYDSVIDLDVFSYDTVKTGNGKTAIEFIDQTRVDVTQPVSYTHLTLPTNREV